MDDAAGSLYLNADAPRNNRRHRKGDRPHAKKIMTWVSGERGRERERERRREGARARGGEGGSESERDREGSRETETEGD